MLAKAGNYLILIVNYKFSRNARLCKWPVVLFWDTLCAFFSPLFKKRIYLRWASGYIFAQFFLGIKCIFFLFNFFSTISIKVFPRRCPVLVLRSSGFSFAPSPALLCWWCPLHPIQAPLLLPWISNCLSDPVICVLLVPQICLQLGRLGDRDKEVQTSKYKTGKTWGWKVEHRKYSQNCHNYGDRGNCACYGAHFIMVKSLCRTPESNVYCVSTALQ